MQASAKHDTIHRNVLCWPHHVDQEMTDEIHTLYDGKITYRDGFEAGDEFITELRFDNLLRVVMRHIHVKTEAAIDVSEKLSW